MQTAADGAEVGSHESGRGVLPNDFREWNDTRVRYSLIDTPRCPPYQPIRKEAVSEAEARLESLVVALVEFLRPVIDIPPQAVVQRESRCHAPLICREKRGSLSQPVSIPGIGVEQGEIGRLCETQRSRRPLAVWADHKIEENRKWKRRKGWLAEKSVQIGKEHQRRDPRHPARSSDEGDRDSRRISHYE